MDPKTALGLPRRPAVIRAIANGVVVVVVAAVVVPVSLRSSHLPMDAEVVLPSGSSITPGPQATGAALREEGRGGPSRSVPLRGPRSLPGCAGRGACVIAAPPAGAVPDGVRFRT